MSEYNVERQSDGWPTGIDKEGKEAMTEAVRRMLNDHPEGLSLDQVQHLSGASTYKDGFKSISKWVLWDAIYCALERACRAAGDRVWVPKRNF